MSGRVKFEIFIDLLTTSFNKKAGQVKASFKAMQMQVLTFAAALGAAGLSLSNFVSRIIDVARETNRVTTSLKNVSGSLARYAENQRFVLDMAKKYGLEVNALTGNFAKFTAAANISGMAMAQQQKVFESVSRACTAFGMSADSSNGTFLALSQMMSKGKIYSEELRLQMGERLPVALQAMAKAAGVSVGKLDSLMKKGKLLSADILPKFAVALDELIPHVDTDNLETSVNRLKNTFTEFVKGTGAQSRYKSFIDFLTALIQKAAGNIKSIITYTVAAILVLVTSKLVNGIIAAIARAEMAAKMAAIRSAKQAGVAFDEIAWKANKASASIKMAFSKALGNLKSLFISSIPTAVIAILGTIVAKFVDMRQEAGRVKSIFKEYKEELAKVSHTTEITQLKVLQGLYNSATEGSKIKEQYQKRIEGLLGKEIKKNENLNDIIRERITLLETSARSEYAAGQKIKAEGDLKELYRKYGGEQAFNFQYNSAVNEMSDSILNIGTPQIIIDFDKAVGFRNIIQDASQILKDSETYLAQHRETFDYTIEDDEPDDKKKKTALEKAQEKYAQELGELNVKLEIGKLRQQEYNKALDELNVQMYAQAKGSGDKQILESKYLKNLEEAVKHPIYNKSQDEFEILQKNYNKSLKELHNKQKAKVISETDYRESLLELNKSTIQAAGAIEGISEEGKNFIAGLKWVNQTLKEKVKIPEVENRDTFYDYKKTKPEILEADKTHAESYRDKIKTAIGSQADELEADLKKAEMTLDQIKSKYKEIAPELISSLDDAMGKVTSLDEALKIAQVKEDVKELGKQLRKNLYSGFKDIASSADRLVSSIESINEVMNDADATGWERFMVTLNGIIQMVDSIMSVVNAIQSVVEVSKELNKAKQAQSSAKNEAAKAGTEALGKIAVTGVQVMADKKAAESAKERAKEISAANENEKLSEIELMAAKVATANASKGFIGIALAAAQIAAFTALVKGASAVASIKQSGKYAGGGIVGGNSYSGDKVNVGVNSGEMILNMRQQSRLFDIANGRGSSQGGKVVKELQLKIDGRDIKAVIHNVDKYFSKIK